MECIAVLVVVVVVAVVRSDADAVLVVEGTVGMVARRVRGEGIGELG